MGDAVTDAARIRYDSEVLLFLKFSPFQGGGGDAQTLTSPSLVNAVRHFLHTAVMHDARLVGYGFALGVRWCDSSTALGNSD